jgi:hypothetical protein
MKKTMISKTMAGRTAVKVFLATALLAGSIVGHGGSANAATAQPTAAPVMMDNLSKYGLTLQVKLPYTSTVNGFSYTLHKIMIFDINSSTAKSLMSQYGYANKTDFYPNAKYFIWTKITIKNGSKYTMGFNSNDLSDKWRFALNETIYSFDKVIPLKKELVFNSKEALWGYTLKPGESLTTYQALLMGADLDKDLRLDIYFKGGVKDAIIATKQ